MVNQEIIIGTDLDDTLWNYADPFFDYCRARLNCGNGRSDSYLAYNLENEWGWSREQMESAFLGFLKEQESFPVLPYPDVLNGLNELVVRNARIIGITSRGEEFFKEATERDVEIYFPGKIKKIFYTNDIWRNGDAIIDKKDICRRESVTDFIDDSAKNVLGVSELGIRCYLISRPWNASLQNSALPKNVKKILGIEEVLQYLPSY